MSNIEKYPKCHMRTSLGNCDPIGGFCTSVNTDICEALHKVADRPTGEWIQKPHKVYLSRDCVPDFNDYHDRQYNEEDHSIVEYWWHCNQCDYEADRWFKPTFEFCPNCGSYNGGENDADE